MISVNIPIKLREVVVYILNLNDEISSTTMENINPQK